MIIEEFGTTQDAWWYKFLFFFNENPLFVSNSNSKIYNKQLVSNQNVYTKDDSF